MLQMLKKSISYTKIRKLKKYMYINLRQEVGETQSPARFLTNPIAQIHAGALHTGMQPVTSNLVQDL